MMNWKKIGVIFCPSGNFPWMYSHASVPFVEPMTNDLIKVYFSSRDKGNRSSIGWVILSINQPREVIKISEQPILAPGQPGFFDSDGVMGCELIQLRNKFYLYYIGWNLGKDIPFRNAIGLAIRTSDHSEFNRISNGPILDRSIYDPCFVASNCVIQKDGLYYMYYLSCTQWVKIENAYQHKYHIKIATSLDGVNWDRSGSIAIDFADADEYAISVPRVLYFRDSYKMWYSYRSMSNPKKYRIGYAESKDAIHWNRLDHLVGLDVSSEGWDSEMICYPYVFKHGTNLYMLYNGNGYGKSGFGMAVLENYI